MPRCRPRNMLRSLGSLAVLAVLLAAPAMAGESQIYVSWHAPHGSPRATDNNNWACSDSTRTDTLYLSFDPGRNSRTFNGFTATLFFHALKGDSLPPYWRMSTARGDTASVRMQADPDPNFACPQPWAVAGMGRALYLWTPNFGRLTLIYAVGTRQAIPVDSGKVYCLARVLIRHGTPRIAGCGRPLCIEWAQAGLAFRVGEDQRVRMGGVRYASINSPGCRVCDDFRAVIPPPVWRPGAPADSSRHQR